MDIFLLCVIIILLLIFHSVKSAKLGRLETKLSKMEDYLRKVQLFQSQKEAEQNKPVSAASETKPPVQKVSETVIPPVIPPVAPVIRPKPEPETVTPPHSIKELWEEARQEREPVRTAVNTTVQQPIRPVQSQLSFYDKFRKNNPDLEKFIGENILSKVAITILVIGIAFFVKYAIDKEWINEIARAGIGILSGGIVLGFAHRLRKNFKAFSSVLVAGGIAVFYFTIGIAFHQYHLFGQTTAFILMLVITSFNVFISVMYDRQELAVLSLIGGFATPFIVSTGQGNYQVLFIYVLILDLGMLVLAYLRKWNLLNILAYAFTMILYMGWLQSKVISEPYAPYRGAIVFASLFYIVFILMSLIHNIRENKKFGAIDITILISNTFLFYGAGMQILTFYHPELKGLFSLLMAAFNMGCAWFLYKKFKADQKLIYLMIGLTLTFVTLVAPVQLHGNYITIFWALESVLLMWLAQKSNIAMYRFASVAIAILMSMSLFIDWSQIYLGYSVLKPVVIFNKAFVTGIICALSVLATAMLLKRESENAIWAGMHFNPPAYRNVLLGIFVALLYFTGMFELLFQLNRGIYFYITIIIIAGAYHFLYFFLLNLVTVKWVQESLRRISYGFNYINAVLYVAFFAILPYTDFNDNIMMEHRAYIGFVFHYVSLGCFIAFLYFTRCQSIQPGALSELRVLNTVLVSVAIVYVCSIELMLHTLQFLVETVKSGHAEEILKKSAELAITRTHIVKIGFPILWGLLAFAFLVTGMRKQNKILRIMALILIGVIVLKLFTYDIKDASEGGKIVAFIILGVLLLFISFMYQKIKKLIIDDKAQTDLNETLVPPHHEPTNP